jgi:hypothetical protein
LSIVLKYCFIIKIIISGLLLNGIIYPESLIDNTVENCIPVRIDNLKKHVRSILDTDGYRHFYNIKALNQTRTYIIDELQKMGYEVRKQQYSVQNNVYTNIIVNIGDPDGKFVVLGAHYDVCFNQDGADNNASGVAGLLEIARFLKTSEGSLTKYFEIAFYTLDEPPNFGTSNMGSYIHATELYDKNIEIELMVYIKTIGYYTDENIQDYPYYFMKWLYPTRGNFIAAVGNLKSRRYIKALKSSINNNTIIQCQSLIYPSNHRGIDFAGYLNFWKYKYRALMITDTAFYRNKNYHSSGDTYETLNFEKMAEVVKGVSHFLFFLDKSS